VQQKNEAGAVVLPANPGFYHGAKTIDDLVDFVVARVCTTSLAPSVPVSAQATVSWPAFRNSAASRFEPLSSSKQRRIN